MASRPNGTNQRGGGGGGGQRGGADGGRGQSNGRGGATNGRGNGGGGYSNGRGNGSSGGRGGGLRNGANEPAQTPQIDNRRERTRIRDDMIEHFEKNDITEGNTILEPKMDPGTIAKATAEFHTNAFGVRMDKVPLFQYHIEINAWKNAHSKKAIFLTKRSAEDYVAVDRKTRCREVFLFLQRTRPDVFARDNRVYYDLQSNILTTAKLHDAEIPVTLKQQDYEKIACLANFIELNIIITECATDNQLTADDMSMARISDLNDYDRSHQAFIELASSQYSLFHPNDMVVLAKGKTYLVAPEKSGMGKNLVTLCQNFSQDKFLGMGVKKSAKYIEGHNGRGNQNVALFIDPIKTAFYKPQTLASLLEKRRVNLSDARDVSSKRFIVADLYVYNPFLSGKRTFQVVGFDKNSPRTKTFKDAVTGKIISVESYFLTKYNKKLQYPNAPLIYGKGKTDFLPIEVAMIDSNQPVPKNKMEQREDAEMVKLTAINPGVQKLEVKTFVTAIGLDKLTLEHDGLQLVKTGDAIVPLTVKGRILQNPEIVYSDNKTTFPGDDGLWNIPKKFLRCGSTKKWGLLKYGREADVNVMRGFQNAFVAMCCKNGMEIPDKPELIGSVGEDGMEPIFVKAKKQGIDFLVFVTDMKIPCQGELKMLERKYEITTQNITAKVANDAAGRGTATLENIVSKTNPKLGGTNYTINHNQDFLNHAFGPNCLIIGIALSHAGSIDPVQKARGGTQTATALSAVGYAANTGADPYEFYGDHLPNNPHRSEILDLIPGIIDSTITQYKENKKTFPTSMILYLNGSSEGEYALLKRFEVPLVFKKMNELMSREIPLTVIIPQRSHVARLYKTQPNLQDKAAQQNIPPGLVVDTGLVHPTINEFYLNAHTAIQGTARTPKYTILYNNNPKVNMDAIQHITYYLCFAHQIVNSPTSLPSPVYIAMAYAERGTKMYKCLPTSIPEEIVEKWSYFNSNEFKNKRVNA